MLKHLDCFGKDEFAIHALGCEEADLTGFCIALVQTLERYALTVTYPVIREITECNRLCTRRRFRSERRGEDALSENGIELPVTERGLPKVLTVGVLKFADDFNRGIVENPDCVFAVRSLKRIEQVDEFVRRDGFSAAAVTPISAPPVALKMPVGLPVPLPMRNASSSALPILRANSLVK